MKKVLLFLCLIYSVMLFSQTKISVYIENCRKALYSDRHGLGEFTLYKNDSLYGKYIVYENSIIDSLPDGKYYIEYDTYFGKRKSELLYIDKDSFLPSFEVCVDELPDELKKSTTNLFIDNLEEGEELPIYRKYSGCFNYSNEDSLVVKKDNGKYYIIRNKKRRRLNDKQLGVLRDFEIQMRNIKKSNSYSTSWCNTRIALGEDEISFGAPTGDWEGYEYLLIQLWFVKKKKSFYFKK